MKDTQASGMHRAPEAEREMLEVGLKLPARRAHKAGHGGAAGGGGGPAGTRDARRHHEEPGRGQAAARAGRLRHPGTAGVGLNILALSLISEANGYVWLLSELLLTVLAACDGAGSC